MLSLLKPLKKTGYAELRTFVPIVLRILTAHPNSRHVMHERALRNKMNNERADGRFYSFAWI